MDKMAKTILAIQLPWLTKTHKYVLDRFYNDIKWRSVHIHLSTHIPFFKKYNAITFDRNIYVKSDTSLSFYILIHEFAHVQQYQKLGFIKFIVTYLWQYIKYKNYRKIPLEIDAYKKANHIISYLNHLINLENSK